MAWHREPVAALALLEVARIKAEIQAALLVVRADAAATRAVRLATGLNVASTVAAPTLLEADPALGALDRTRHRRVTRVGHSPSDPPVATTAMIVTAVTAVTAAVVTNGAPARPAPDAMVVPRPVRLDATPVPTTLAARQPTRVADLVMASVTTATPVAPARAVRRVAPIATTVPRRIDVPPAQRVPESATPVPTTLAAPAVRLARGSATRASRVTAVRASHPAERGLACARVPATTVRATTDDLVN